ncbi:MAG: hypothetical protein JW852_00700, partial [Spirochaetales bacterium]|nr:hypothetical protein [Spirochaetales bacterium]
MIALQRIYMAVLVVLLVFNLTQRRHLDHGEKKRVASLMLAGLALLNYAAAIVFTRFSIPPIYLVIPLLIAVFVGIRFRKTLFVFRLHCASCDAPLPVAVTLYHDDNLCLDCRERRAAAGEAAASGAAPTPQDVREIDWDSWKPDQKAALCLILQDHRVLLIRKKTGLG